MKQVNLLCEVLHERDNQDEKWGEQNHNPAIWLAILQEEVGELATAIIRQACGPEKHRDTAGLRAEAVQVAAVAVAFVEYLDRQEAEDDTQDDQP